VVVFLLNSLLKDDKQRLFSEGRLEGGSRRWYIEWRALQKT
jgi:hypothetical protein